MMTYMSQEQVPESEYTIKLGWITERPPEAIVQEHTHTEDEIIILWGNNHEYPQVLGGEVEIDIGGQKIEFNTTAGIYIPAGLPHGPMTWKSYKSPHILMSMMMAPDTPGPGLRQGVVDHEQYIIRSPMREAGAELTSGRTAPTMTYMSGVQIPGVKTYIEFGWTFGMPKSSRTTHAMPAMAHKNYEEIVLHIGGDPEDPLDLGGDLEFHVGGQPLAFNTSTALFIPRNVLHGPIKCLAYRKPHIVMAIMCGAGSIKEGWEGSFKEDD
jgi:uncharacterized RmlC-like cupin family protein